jgi:Ca2+-binding EF-hand superfamily protein
MNAYRTSRWLHSLSLGLGIAAATTVGLIAQDRERGEGRRRSRDPSEFLQRFDANKNGLLEPSEVPQFGRDFIARAAQHAGLDQSQAMPLDKLAEGMRASRESRDEDRGDRREERRDEGRGSSSSGPSPTPPSSAKPSSSPAVPGFGSQEKEAAKAPGFSVPLESPGGKLEDRYDRRIIDKVDREVLPQYDRNKDGAISYDEAKGGRWDPPIETSDLDKDGRVTRFELFERYVKKMGLPAKTSVVYSTSPGSSSHSSQRPAVSPDTAKVAEYAKGLLNRYDQNKNGMLERDEWKEMKADHQAADANKDGVITVEELTAKLANFAAQGSSGSSSGSSSAASSGSSPSGRSWSGRRGGGDEKTASSTTGPRKTYRFLSPTERLPKGLPDWFARNDANGDGQVMMAEYSTSFTDTVVAEFLKYDVNRDGVITPDECLEVVESEKTPKK